VPPDLRAHLSGAFAVRRNLERSLACARAAAAVPPEFDTLMKAEFARMERAARRLVNGYRRGEITLGEFESHLEVEFDGSRDPPPEVEALLVRGPFPRRP
jgi:hypothetical protein